MQISLALFYFIRCVYLCSMNSNFKPRPGSFKNTFCIFTEVELTAIDNLKIQYESKAGSTYYYTKEGMYRYSNHWGRLANSKWRLEPMNPESVSKRKLGFAKWDSFYPDNATDKLYYLEANFETKTVQYQHINNPLYDKKAVVRNSLDTRKRIKQVRNLFELESWSKYFDEEDIDLLRKKIITRLIETDKGLDEIKNEVKLES
jgi:hypothetical protein